MPASKNAFNALDNIGSTVKKLGVYNNGKLIETGQYVPRAEAQKPFELAFSEGEGPLLVVMLDIDAPYPSFTVLGPILHWVQSGLVPQADRTLSCGSTPFTCDYIAPGPPPGSGPHRYCLFLYDQPKDYDVAKFAPPNGQSWPKTSRMRTDLDAFEKKLGLGPIIACNYYTSN